MKKLLIALCVLCVGCEHKAEFYIDGVGCYTKKRCVKSHTEFITQTTYDATLNMPMTSIIPMDECDSSVIDTIKLTTKTK